ncbi:MAG: DNA adenine methylase [Opitutaceae bacterium]|nr:DNA adenine methylase [Opitutaceae bacterium]
MIGVTIENLDFRKIIPKFDSPDTLFYIDPPYPMSTRSAGGKGYVHEMADECHRQLAWLLHQSQGKVAISGYACPLYDQLYADWRRDEKPTTANGQRGSVPRNEVLWMNYVS